MANTVILTEQPVLNWETFEVPVTSNGLSQVSIPDIPLLKSYGNRKVIIKSIELVSPKVLTDAPLSGNTVSPLSELVKCSLVLYVNGWEREHYIPLLRLNAMRDADSTAATTIPYADKPMMFESLNDVDWTKSYIKYSNTTVSAGATYSFLFTVSYVIVDAASNKVIKP